MQGQPCLRGRFVSRQAASRPPIRTLPSRVPRRGPPPPLTFGQRWASINRKMATKTRPLMMPERARGPHHTEQGALNSSTHLFVFALFQEASLLPDIMSSYGGRTGSVNKLYDPYSPP